MGARRRGAARGDVSACTHLRSASTQNIEEGIPGELRGIKFNNETFLRSLVWQTSNHGAPAWRCVSNYTQWTRRQSCGVNRSLIRHLASRNHLFSDTCKQISWQVLESFACCSLPKKAFLILAWKTCPLNTHDKFSLPSFFCSVCPAAVLQSWNFFAAVPQAATGQLSKLGQSALPSTWSMDESNRVESVGKDIVYSVRHRLSSSTAMKRVVLSFRWLYQSLLEWTEPTVQ